MPRNCRNLARSKGMTSLCSGPLWVTSRNLRCGDCKTILAKSWGVKCSRKRRVSLVQPAVVVARRSIPSRDRRVALRSKIRTLSERCWMLLEFPVIPVKDMSSSDRFESALKCLKPSSVRLLHQAIRAVFRFGQYV